ncbi:F-box/LRR-repeat protein 12-like [Dendronephthya gigantea]|uniref:F-box/LRR-repeat protein 12-like n=1 Tax=Dendronephthya gigantea TaxID=151771 RepID=UPI00106D647E|nr:F-box/LRR-repeat protein 12-like [Dendronephthya gigantea]
MAVNMEIQKLANINSKENTDKFQREIFICHLPPNILLTIFQFLDLKSLCKSSRVCRLWYNYTNDPSLWKVIDLRPYQINLRGMKKIVNRRVSECTKELYIKGLVTATKKIENLSGPLLEEIRKRANNLECLRLYNCYLKNVGIQLLPSCINELSLAESLVPLGWFEPLKQNNLLPSLEHLSLESCTRISSEDISSICELKTLKTLILRGCYRIIDDDLKTISMNLKKLTQLDLCDCKKIKDVSLHHISHHLKDIQILCLSSCYHITPLGIAVLKDGNLNKLVSLDILGCSHETQQKALKLFADNPDITLRTLLDSSQDDI